MHLSEDWKEILKRAWSVRLIVLAGVLTAAETVLPLFWETLPRGVFAALSFVVTGAALIARLIAQKGLD